MGVGLGRSDHEVEFDSLTKFAPTLDVDNRAKAQRFLEGLASVIRSPIHLLRELSFCEVVDDTFSIEVEYRAMQPA